MLGFPRLRVLKLCFRAGSPNGIYLKAQGRDSAHPIRINLRIYWAVLKWEVLPQSWVSQTLDWKKELPVTILARTAKAIADLFGAHTDAAAATSNVIARRRKF